MPGRRTPFALRILVVVTILAATLLRGIPSVAASQETASPEVVRSPDAMPATPVGRQLAWVLDVLGGDAQEMSEADITAHFAPALLAALSPAQALTTTRQFAAA